MVAVAATKPSNGVTNGTKGAALASDSDTNQANNAKGGKGDDKKKKRRQKKKVVGVGLSGWNRDAAKGDDDKGNNANVEIEYVPAPLPSLTNDPSMKQFEEVFSRFNSLAETGAGIELEEPEEVPGAAPEGSEEEGKKKDEKEAESDEDDEENEAALATSRKKKKLAQRLSVAQLKQLVPKPEVVEWVDVTAADPKLLVTLKATRNTVQVPIHWQQKRKYLQGKRGIEKPPFDLPDFIKATGIMEIRQSAREKEETASLKSKTRARVQPKMGKLDIDYQKLHDAFFRWQTKPRLTRVGDVYYEGKEFETKVKIKKPGQLSDELKAALGMGPLIPPPWLINMQRYGPPPSYPGLRIPGLNAPIPEGAEWGFHPGGWGKPPVDEYGRPLYGDVFGAATVAEVAKEHIAEVERTPWGELESDEEAEAEEEEEEEDEEEEQGGAEDYASTRGDDESIRGGMETPSGFTSSVPGGIETPDYIELRKEARRDEPPKELYTVLPQRDQGAKGFMGSAHTYDVSALSHQQKPPPPPPTSEPPTKKRKGVTDFKRGVQVALNPEDLADGLGGDAVRRAYEDQMATISKDVRGEDFSDLVAEHASKQEAKRRKKDKEEKKDGAAGRKEKFKF
ncbi:Splicing factor 3B subunit 2 [Chytridiales sp. JEL 0842]|nr:Splicing factor 3B subunit 2 [Chytridiales sp. JEL 0842]